MDETDSDAVIVSERDMSELSPEEDLNDFVLDDSNETTDVGIDDDSDEVVSPEEVMPQEEVLWHEELDQALSGDFVDHGIIKSICKCRVIPKHFRTKVWKICLNVTNRSNSMLSWDKKLDLAEQDVITADSKQLVESVIDDVDDDVIQQTTDDIIAVMTFYCKSRAVKYKTELEWTKIVRTLLTMEKVTDRTDLYNCFYAIQSRYIPRQDLSSCVTQAPFNLLRLLLLYHDPELCNFLDTCKITPEMFTRSWFSTLFSSVCNQDVTCALWDIYLQRSDPFFIFFLSLVILVNAKEQILTTGEIPDIQTTIDVLSSAPSVLTSSDVDDFCQLASYYSERTPSSFRRDLAACYYNGAMITSASKVDVMASELQNSFCLKISIPELLLSSQPRCHGDDIEDENSPQIRYFVVDCRPAEQYNEGHLLTAFHLDATLMLSEPAEFDEALTALFHAQEQAIQAGSTAGGEHLCFIGSGKEEEDSYMYMVIANLLQKRRTYISVARGGYLSLLDYLADVSIDINEWIVGNQLKSDKKTSKKQPHGGTGDVDSSDSGAASNKQKMETIMKKMAGNLLQKSFSWKEKVTKFIENTDEEWLQAERNASSSKSSKKRNLKSSSTTTKNTDDIQPVFSIDDDDDDDDVTSDDANLADDEMTSHRVVGSDIGELGAWRRKPDTLYCFECQAVQATDGQLCPAYLHITKTHIRCLLEVKPKKRRGGPQLKHTWVRALTPRALRAVVRITSRRSFPELITFKFGDENSLKDMTTEGSSDKIEIIASERYIIPDAGTATKAIKQLIVENDVAYTEAATKQLPQNDDQPSTSSA